MDGRSSVEAVGGSKLIVMGGRRSVEAVGGSGLMVMDVFSRRHSFGARSCADDLRYLRGAALR